MALPRISVVVPSLNQAPFLTEALESVLSQDYPGLELIVMDGGSTDGSLDIIRAHEGRIAYWQSRPDGGQSAAINRGVERTTGEIVCWLNSDDLLCEGALLHVGQAAAKLPGFGMVIGNGWRLDHASGGKVPYCPRPLAFSRRALREGGAYVHQPSTFFARAAWERVGGLNEHLRYCMDWDVIMRIADLFPVVLTDAYLAVTREYEDTKTAAGGMERAEEIRRMIEANTGRPLTAGAAIFLIEAMIREAGETFGPRFFRQLSLARNEAAQRLSEVTGTPDCFPAVSDAGDVKVGAPTASPEPARSQPRLPPILGRLWAERPRGLLYRFATGAVVSAATLRLLSRDAALAQLRRWHDEGLFATRKSGRDPLS